MPRITPPAPTGAQIAADPALTSTFASGRKLWVPARQFQSCAGTPTFDTLRTGGNGWPCWLMQPHTSGEAVEAVVSLPGPWTTYGVTAYIANAGAGTGDAVLQLAYGHTGEGENTTAMTVGSSRTVVAGAQYILDYVSMDTGLVADPAELQAIRIATVVAGSTLANDIALYGVMLEAA